MYISNDLSVLEQQYADLLGDEKEKERKRTVIIIFLLFLLMFLGVVEATYSYIKLFGSVNYDKDVISNIYMELIEIEDAKKFFEAETKFNVMIADVNKIIGESIRDVMQ